MVFADFLVIGKEREAAVVTVDLLQTMLVPRSALGS